MKKHRGPLLIVLVCSAAALTALTFHFFSPAPDQPSGNSSAANSSQTNFASKVFNKSQPSETRAGDGRGASPAKNTPQLHVKYFENSLPQEGLPLSSTFQVLKRDAEQGNYWAACRLAADVYECTTRNMLQSQLAFVRSTLTAVGSSPDELSSARREIEILEKELPKSAALCEGNNATDVEPWKYLLQAALAGHVPSKAAFVLRPPINISNMFSNIEFADAYKGNAPTLLVEAAAAGNVEVAEGAAWGYLGASGISVFQPGFGIKLLPTDFFRAAVYYYASSGLGVTEQSHFNRREDLRKRIEAATTIDQRIRAKVEAENMTASWAANRLESHSYSQGQQKKRDGNYGQMCADL